VTRSQALAALRRALVPAVLAAGATLALVLALLLTRDPLYQARIGIVATPVADGTAEGPEYGAVVSSIMPALPEVAVSTPVLDRLAGRLPELDAATLSESVAVELVPASGVARVTVTGDSPEAATAILRAVVDEIVGSNLLAPVGTFTVLGDVGAEPAQVGPDPLLAGGLGVLAAVVVGLLAVAAVQVLRPRLLTVADVEQVVHSVASSAVPVVALGRRQGGVDVLASRLALAAPGATRVRTFPAGPGTEDGVAAAIDERLARRALDHGPPPRDGGDDGRLGAANGRAATDARHRVREAVQPEPAIVTVQLRRTTTEELTAALLAAVDSGHELGAVVAR
jgi:capsular polysaccharide biosynthesis protein